MKKQHQADAQNDRAYEQPTIVAIGALHELTLSKPGPGSDYCNGSDFPSGTR